MQLVVAIAIGVLHCSNIRMVRSSLWTRFSVEFFFKCFIAIFERVCNIFLEKYIHSRLNFQQLFKSNAWIGTLDDDWITDAQDTHKRQNKDINQDNNDGKKKKAWWGSIKLRDEEMIRIGSIIIANERHQEDLVSHHLSFFVQSNFLVKESLQDSILSCIQSEVSFTKNTSLEVTDLLFMSCTWSLNLVSVMKSLIPLISSMSTSKKWCTWVYNMCSPKSNFSEESSSRFISGIHFPRFRREHHHQQRIW